VVVVSEVTVTEEMALAGDGTGQLRRRWSVPAPVAALLIVHGIGEHSGRYLHVGRFFAERGYDVASFDNRGFGRSGGRRGHVDSFDRFLDDIEERLDERRRLGVPVVLLGHSLGGLMAADYLVGSRPGPDLAVLSSPALAAEVPTWQRVAAPILGRLTPKLFIRGGIDGAGLSRDPEVQRAYVDDPLRIAGATAGLGQAVFTAIRRVNANLDRLDVPTYVLHGEVDPVVPPSASRVLAGRADVTYRSWPGLRHECFNEPEQDEVMAELAAWLESELARRS
jgi:alpha-beta hydrolase superfamily lysophospholipase